MTPDNQALVRQTSDCADHSATGPSASGIAQFARPPATFDSGEQPVMRRSAHAADSKRRDFRILTRATTYSCRSPTAIVLTDLPRTRSLAWLRRAAPGATPAATPLRGLRGSPHRTP